MAKDPKKTEAALKAQQLVTALGSMSEMAHTVYNSMIQSGADRREAEVAMTGWIGAFWHESMDDARRSKEGQQDETQTE